MILISFFNKNLSQAVEIMNNQLDLTITLPQICFTVFIIIAASTKDSEKVSRYKRLIKMDQKLKNEGSTLAKFSLELAKRLQIHRTSLLNQIKWKNRYQYISLMSDFIDDKIVVEQYISQFFDIEEKCATILLSLEKDSDKIENLNEPSKEFCQLLEKAYIDCQNFQSDVNLDGRASIFLRESARQTLLKLKKTI